MADDHEKSLLSHAELSAKLLMAFSMSAKLRIEAAESCHRADDVIRRIRGIKSYWRSRRPAIANGARI
jgi:hypothetical protein